MPVSETVRVLECDVDIQSQGPGEPVLFLHGLEGISVKVGTWPSFLDLLADRLRVIAPAHPGFGRCALPDHFTSIDDLTFHYLDLLDALQLDRAHVVGHSFGGWVAAELAVTAGKRIDRLVLANPLGLWLVDKPIPDIFMLSPADVVAQAFEDEEIGREYVPTGLDESEEWYADWSSVSRFGWSPFLHDPKLEHRLHRITAPTLVIGSANDRITPPDYARAFHERILRSELKIVGKGGHALPLERPEEFAALVADFLTAAVPAGS